MPLSNVTLCTTYVGGMGTADGDVVGDAPMVMEGVCVGVRVDVAVRVGSDVRVCRDEPLDEAVSEGDAESVAATETELASLWVTDGDAEVLADENADPEAESESD